MHQSSLNNILLGTVSGLILPLLTAVIIYQVRFNAYEFKPFISMLNAQGTLTQLLSLCAIPNLLIFFLFIWTNRLLSARGILLATFIVAAAIIATKIIS